MIEFTRENTWRESGILDDMEYDFAFTRITPNIKAPLMDILERVDNFDNTTDYLVFLREDVNDDYFDKMDFQLNDILDLSSFVLELSTLVRANRNL